MAKRPIECGIITTEIGGWDFWTEKSGGKVLHLGLPEEALAKMHTRITWTAAYMLTKFGVGAFVIMNALENHPDLFLASAQIITGAFTVYSLRNDKDNFEVYISAKSQVDKIFGR